jgi:predicted outer membrane protein
MKKIQPYQSVTVITPSRLRAASLLTAVTLALCLGQTAFADTSLNWSDRHFVNETSDSNHEDVALAQLASQQASNPSVRAFAQQVVTDHRQLGQDLSQLAAQKSLTLDSEVTVMAPVAVNSTTQANLGSNAVIPLGGPNSSYSGANMGALTDTPTGNRIQAQGTPVSPGVTQASANPGSDLQVLATTGANMDGANRTVQYQATSTTTTATAANPWDDRKYRRLARMNGTDFDREYLALAVSAHEDEVKDFQKKSRDASDPDVRAFASKELPTLQAHLDRAQSLAQSMK